MKQTSILGAVKSYYDADPVSFHVPGHKNGRGLSRDFIQMDVTEIPGTDNLHHPEEAILETQRRASKAYGSKATYFLVNGTTCGNQAMLLGATRPGDTVLIARNAHKSVHTACILGDLAVEYVQPEVHEQYDIPMGVQADKIEVKLRDNPRIKAVVITSPTYEGIHSDIKSIAEIVHAYGAVLLVDEAHGAHVPLNENFGPSALDCGADVCVQSTHKSLNALTQASMLHIGSERIDPSHIEKWLAMLQSSSPSYPLMMSLESALSVMETEGREMASRLCQHIQWFKDQMSWMQIPVLGIEDVSAHGFTHDISKLVVFVNEAEKIEDALRKEFDIQVEYATADSLVCVCSIWNTKSDFIKFAQGLKALSVTAPKVKLGLTNYPQIRVLMQPRQAFYSAVRTLPLEASIGSVCAEYVIPYPPGIPLLSPGEEITQEILTRMDALKKRGHAVIGTSDKTLKTIQVIDMTKSEA